MTLTKAQKRLIAELRTGRIVHEDNFHSNKKLSYETAEIHTRFRDTYTLPRRISKRTVWALLEQGLLKQIRPWWNSQTKVYILLEMKEFFIDRG